MTALNLTPDEALALADQWCAGLTMDADSKGWGAILLVLAEEVRRLRMELAHEEQRVADMMDAVNRVGHEIERLRAAVERVVESADRDPFQPVGFIVEHVVDLRAVLADGEEK